MLIKQNLKLNFSHHKTVKNIKYFFGYSCIEILKAFSLISPSEQKGKKINLSFRFLTSNNFHCFGSNDSRQ